MNRLLQRYAHNVVVDQILFWSANRREIRRITPEPTYHSGARVLISFCDGEFEPFDLLAGAFQEIWDEARIVLSTATNIPGDFRPLTSEELDTLEPARRSHSLKQAESLAESVNRDLAQSMIEVEELFKERLYEMFLDETGIHIKYLSDTMKAKIAYSLKHQKAEPERGSPRRLAV